MHYAYGAESTLRFQNIEFGAAASNHIDALEGAQVKASGNWTVSGNATYHVVTSLSGIFSGESRTITVSGTPAFTTFARATRLSVQSWNNSSFSGSATGKLYSVEENSVIKSGATVFPGDVAGTTATGGQYI